MVKLVFNTNNEFNVTAFNRNTTFNGEEISSSAYCNITYTSENSATLHELALSPITSIQIKKDNEVIYDAGNITARITYIDETLNTDFIAINLNLQFN